MTDLPIKIRLLSHPGIPMFDQSGMVTNQEKAYIASSWSHQVRAQPEYCWVSRRAFHYQYYLGFVCPLVEERPELFTVAANVDNGDQIFGWACATDKLVYQYHVKEDFREYGIRDILLAGKRVCTPTEIERLINGIQNQAAKDRLSQGPNHSRQAHVPTSGCRSRQEAI